MHTFFELNVHSEHLEINPEIMAYGPFETLLKSSRARQSLTFLYLFINPASPFAEYSFPEKKKNALEFCRLESEPDSKVYLECKKIYEDYFKNIRVIRACNAFEKIVDDLIQSTEDSIISLDSEGKKVLELLEKLPDYIEKINTMKTTYLRSISKASLTRAGAEKGLFEDGI